MQKLNETLLKETSYRYVILKNRIIRYEDITGEVRKGFVMKRHDARFIKIRDIETKKEFTITKARVVEIIK